MQTKNLPAKLNLSSITAIADTREQQPWSFSRIQLEPGTLATGDYSLSGPLGSQVAIERKSLPDLVGVVGRDRERFERELVRMMAYPTRAIICEATWAEIDAGQWRGKVTVPMVRESLASWISRGIPVVMAGTPSRAAFLAESILIKVAQHRYRELRGFAGQLTKPCGNVPAKY